MNIYCLGPTSLTNWRTQLLDEIPTQPYPKSKCLLSQHPTLYYYGPFESYSGGSSVYHNQQSLQTADVIFCYIESIDITHTLLSLGRALALTKPIYCYIQADIYEHYSIQDLICELKGALSQVQYQRVETVKEAFEDFKESCYAIPAIWLTDKQFGKLSYLLNHIVPYFETFLNRPIQHAFRESYFRNLTKEECRPLIAQLESGLNQLKQSFPRLSLSLSLPISQRYAKWKEHLTKAQCEIVFRQEVAIFQCAYETICRGYSEAGPFPSFSTLESDWFNYLHEQDLTKQAKKSSSFKLEHVIPKPSSSTQPLFLYDLAQVWKEIDSFSPDEQKQYVEQIQSVLSTNGLHIKSFPNPSEEFMLTAIQSNPEALKHITNPPLNVILKAIKEDNNIITHLPPKFKIETESLASQFVQENGLLLKYVIPKAKTQVVCEQAFQENPKSFPYIPPKYHTREMIFTILPIQPLWIGDAHTRFRTIEFYQQALKYLKPKDFSKFFKLIPKKFMSFDFLSLAIRQSPLCLQSIPSDKRSLELCQLAFDLNPDVLPSIPQDFRTPDLLLRAIQHNRDDIKHLDPSLRTEEHYIAYISHHDMMPYIGEDVLLGLSLEFQKELIQINPFILPYFQSTNWELIKCSLELVFTQPFNSNERWGNQYQFYRQDFERLFSHDQSKWVFLRQLETQHQQALQDYYEKNHLEEGLFSTLWNEICTPFIE